MKIQFFVVAAVVMLFSCNTGPQTGDNRRDSTATNLDTTGLAEFQAMKAQNELGTQTNEEEQAGKSTSQPVKKNTTSASSTDNASSTKEDGTGTGSSSGSTAKKGWSKTAKGAVIGGVVGAGTGAVVNKKNRAAGAVIGGVIGAGAGAVVGNEMDKKDGRH